MQRSNILAHRGYWVKSEEQNSLKSLIKALQLGYGIETDLRDFNGDIVVSHDPPHEDGLIRFKDFCDEVNGQPTLGRIALNIKSDGLAVKLSNFLKDYPRLLEECFVFDMSIPDSIAYLKSGLAFYGRTSEFEIEMAFRNQASGIWVDNFTDSFDQIAASLDILENKHRAAIVSSELHGRDYKNLWQQIKEAKLPMHSNFELCTDYPDLAAEYFVEFIND